MWVVVSTDSTCIMARPRLGSLHFSHSAACVCFLRNCTKRGGNGEILNEVKVTAILNIQNMLHHGHVCTASATLLWSVDTEVQVKTAQLR